MREMIEVSLKIKKSVVEFDEFDQNHRRSKNYGHSIGHALEAMTKYQTLTNCSFNRNAH